MGFICCRVCVPGAGGDTTQEGRRAVSEAPDFVQSRYGMAEFHNRAIELSGSIYLTFAGIISLKVLFITATLRITYITVSGTQACEKGEAKVSSEYASPPSLNVSLNISGFIIGYESAATTNLHDTDSDVTCDH